MSAVGTRIHRSRQNRMIAGVVGGLAEHWGFDPALMRLGFILLSVLSAAFPGILVYIILWIVLPESDV